MSDISPSFDPALLFSDYLPSPQSFEYPPLQAEESYSDELEAIDLQREEQREILDKKGVVIRHRQLNPVPAFRSSSLPPETPTRSTSNRQFTWNIPTSSPCPEDTVPPSSPTTPRATMTFDSSALAYPSSSPPLITPPPAKRQKVIEPNDESFDYPDSDEEAAPMGQDKEDSVSPPKAPEEDSLKTPTAPLKPVFNLPLSGGLFSKKFTSTAPRTSYSRPAGEDLAIGSPAPVPDALRGFRAELTPPPQLPPADADLFEAFKASITPAPRAKESVALASTAPTVPMSAYSSTCLPVVLSSGQTFNIRQKSPRIYSTRENYFLSSAPVEDTSGEREDGGPKKSYYGVEISSLLSDYKAEKRIRKAQQEETARKAVDKAADDALAAALQPESETSTKQAAKTLLWSEKYRAKRFTDLVGDERTHRQVLRWFKAWDKIVFPSAANSKSKPEEGERELRKILLIHGPPGLGKTTLAHVAAKQAGYEVVEVNASDERSAGVVKGRVKDILSNEGVKCMGSKTGIKTGMSAGSVALGRPVCLVVDEIDGVTGGGAANEGGFVKALIDLVLTDQKASKVVASGVTRNKKGKKGDLFRLQRPIVAICNDLYAPALKMLRPLAEVVYMRKPPAGLMVGRLKNVLVNEGFRVEDGAVRRLVELSCMDGNVGKTGGDMRAAMVGCEWIACRLRAAAAEAGKATKEKKYLTRKIVEEEFGDGGLGEADGRGGGGGRGCVKEAVERVFYAENEASARGKKEKGKRKRSSLEKLREVVEGLGEFDKIMSDCFATYLTRPYHDDTFLTKPNKAGEWLWFQDLVSTRVFTEQDYELSGYLSSPILAFHNLFSSAVRQKPTGQGRYNRADNGEEEEEVAPFSGPQAEWEVRESTKENKALIASVQTCMNGGIRLHQAFKAVETVAMELAPWVSRILAPSIKPVVIGGSGPQGGVASVRRDGEKRLVMRGVEVMMGLGIEFEKIKVEGIGSGWGWIYRMEPPLDTLSVFRTFTIAPNDIAPAPIRYAVRQVLDQALRKEILLQHEASKLARMGTPLDAPWLKHSTAMAANPENMLKRKKNDVKKDFFGRVVATNEPRIGEEEDEEGGKRKKAKGKREEKNETVWLSFHEGFSNAVRKGVTLDEFMGGLM